MADKPYREGPRQISRANTLWRKLFSVKGEAPEPVPVVPVLGEPIEAQFLNGWRLYEDSISSIGDATHQAQVIIGFANAIPNMMAVLTRMQVYYTPASVGSPIKLGWGATQPTNPTGKPRDFRLGASTFTGQLLNRSMVDQAALYSVAVDVYPSGSPDSLSTVHEVICDCGDGIVITGATTRLIIASSANTETIHVRYCWRERIMEPSEVNQS